MARIEVEISGNSKYFYTTTERVLRCPKCKRDYKLKRFCKHCKINTIQHIKVRTGIITKDLKTYSCSCVFSSWFRFGKHWKENHPKSNCKHVKEALIKIKKELKIDD